jgi:hypothetical protein
MQLNINTNGNKSSSVTEAREKININTDFAIWNFFCNLLMNICLKFFLFGEGERH